MSTMLRYFKIEKCKLRYRKTFLLVLAMLAVELFWIWYSFQGAIKNWQGCEYYGLIYDIPQLIIIFFPLTLGIIASRLCDMEHRTNTFKLLCTVEKKKSIFNIKVFKGMQYIFLLTIAQFVLILFMGGLYHYEQQIPWQALIFLLLEIFIVSACIFLMQLILSLLIENQLIPLVIGLIGSFSGIFTLYVPQLRPFTIWGYYALLAPVGFWWDKDTRTYGAYGIPCQWSMLLIFAGIALFFYFIGRYLFEKREV